MSTSTPPPIPARRHRRPREYPVVGIDEVMNTAEKECNAVVGERYGSGKNKVILLPEAAERLYSIVSYGRRSPMNFCEQKINGLGHFLIDEEGNHITVISHVIEINTMNRTPYGASITAPDGSYNHGLEFFSYYSDEFVQHEAEFNTDAFGFKADPFLKLCGASEYAADIHTHPSLGVFFSSADRNNGAARAASLPIAIMVIDPIKKKMLAATGKDFEDTEIIIYKRRQKASDGDISRNSADTDMDRLHRIIGKCKGGDLKVRTRINGQKEIRIRLLLPKER